MLQESFKRSDNKLQAKLIKALGEAVVIFERRWELAVLQSY